MEYINRLLHRNSPSNSTANSPEPPSVNDPEKSPEHEVKVKFAREFTDVPHTTDSNSISSASSFQSLASTVSSLIPPSPSRTNTSYTNLEVSGLDDLISACAGIRLEDTLAVDHSLAEASFTSASDEPILNQTTDLPNDATQVLDDDHNGTRVLSGRTSPLNQPEKSSIKPDEPGVNCPNVTITVTNDHVNSPEYKTATESFLQTSPSNPESLKNPEVNQTSTNTTYQNVSAGDLTFDTDCPSLPSLQSISLKSSGEFKEPFPVKAFKRSVSPQLPPGQSDSPAVDSTPKQEVSVSSNIPDTSGHCISSITEPTFVEKQKDVENSNELSLAPEERKEENPSPLEIIPELLEQTNKLATEDTESLKTGDVPLEETSDPEELERTIILQETDDILDVPESEQYEAFKPQRQSTETHPRPFPPIPTPSSYLDFLPNRQSTGLSDFVPPPNDFQSQDQADKTPTPFSENNQRFFDASEDIPSVSENPEEPSGVFEKFRLEAETIAHEIINASLELTEDNDNLGSTNANELFKDPSSFDFFESQTSAKSTVDRLRESLFIKFDPLVSNVTMLPQGNTASPPNDERNGDQDSESLPNMTTPKRNPAIAAIDRLLFYSPMPASAIQKHEEVEKIEVVEKTPEPVPVVDSAMAKELELVRSTVLQLEDQLQKEKVERERERKEAEKQRESFAETVSQLQKQLAQEIKNKNQINVVVDEYEKSISRLVAERERDKKSLDGEKSVLMEELQDTKDHLMASEAAFNDVHAKYERLKIVVTTLKNNESALKESLAENVEIIKALENRYEQIKTHAAARLEKANQDLDAIRKQHDSEMVKLRAILRKEELKSNSLNEIVEQKTKENKELTQILDEVIARVGAKSDD
ncbi:transforming acidic coiled-coil-containing protein 1 isoform X2 [Fopius arisanus]|uniref:Transforming acidic coiled-coil-containing protein 1 isoform X2 n=1 Tax=Fopius arisanus TaxID=64838 RepID=A0A9R1TJV3_9HYME|nr:PREDICTED: transforming acidic coiled-coil-containing protein 1 isoform X2 [Fopius arisanus]